MVYGIIGMINFAHGDIYMIGAFVSLVGFMLLAVFGITSVPLAFFLVLVFAMFFTAVYGWTVERVAYRPLRRAPRLDRKTVVKGQSVSVRVDLGGLRTLKKKKP